MNYDTYWLRRIYITTLASLRVALADDAATSQPTVAPHTHTATSQLATTRSVRQVKHRLDPSDLHF